MGELIEVDTRPIVGELITTVDDAQEDGADLSVHTAEESEVLLLAKEVVK